MQIELVNKLLEDKIKINYNQNYCTLIEFPKNNDTNLSRPKN